MNYWNKRHLYRETIKFWSRLFQSNVGICFRNISVYILYQDTHILTPKFSFGKASELMWKFSPCSSSGDKPPLQTRMIARNLKRFQSVRTFTLALCNKLGNISVGSFPCYKCLDKGFVFCIIIDFVAEGNDEKGESDNLTNYTLPSCGYAIRECWIRRVKNIVFCWTIYPALFERGLGLTSIVPTGNSVRNCSWPSLNWRLWDF